MRRSANRAAWIAAAGAGVFVFGLSSGAGKASELEKQREDLLKRFEETHKITPEQDAQLKKVFSGSQFIGQGNPAVTKHAATTEACQEKLKKEGVSYDNPQFEKICGAKYMAPLYNPEKEKPEDAKACIDQFEFPDIPCDYPVVWVRAKEAAEICWSIGKRLCDAHEWEGACEGKLTDPDYDFDLAKGKAASPAVNAMRNAHNARYGKHKTWSYGSAFQKGICASNSTKDAECNGGNWQKCGSNTYPTGFFPKCKSTLDVYDIHGNAAEHMNLPLNDSQMSSRGSKTLGVTEMKGSWFIWDKYYAHQDWCRWRAPYWHGSPVMDDDSHHNYHLGFRCCKTVR